jgi:hypothetical protein
MIRVAFISLLVACLSGCGDSRNVVAEPAAGTPGGTASEAAASIPGDRRPVETEARSPSSTVPTQFEEVSPSEFREPAVSVTNVRVDAPDGMFVDVKDSAVCWGTTGRSNSCGPSMPSVDIELGWQGDPGGVPSNAEMRIWTNADVTSVVVRRPSGEVVCDMTVRALGELPDVGYAMCPIDGEVVEQISAEDPTYEFTVLGATWRLRTT